MAFFLDVAPSSNQSIMIIILAIFVHNEHGVKKSCSKM
jgi:hypothetical protein